MTFEPLLSPNFIPNFGKILGAVFEICRDVRTHVRTHGTDSIGPFGFKPGTKKCHIALIRVFAGFSGISGSGFVLSENKNEQKTRK